MYSNSTQTEGPINTNLSWIVTIMFEGFNCSHLFGRYTDFAKFMVSDCSSTSTLESRS